MHQGDPLGYFPLETEVGGFLVPTNDGGGDIVHGLDSLHDSNRDSSREIGDVGGSIFDFIVLDMNNV